MAIATEQSDGEEVGTRQSSQKTKPPTVGEIMTQHNSATGSAGQRTGASLQQSSCE